MLLGEHEVLSAPEDFDDMAVAIAVAMGHFKGAKEAPALQFKFIDRLNEIVDNEQRRLFLNQLYGIDQRSEKPMEESRWEGYLEEPISENVTAVLALLSIPVGITEEYTNAPKEVELLTHMNGKWIAESKEEDYGILTDYLKQRGQIYGKAIDNGDCFYDALAQLLESDVAALRQQVLEKLESDPERYKAEVAKKKKNNDWDTYIKLVGLPAEKLPEGAIPCWGDIHFEGKILAEIYNVQITCHQVLEKKDREEAEIDVVPTPSIGPKDSKLIELANVGQHFMPVFAKLED